MDVFQQAYNDPFIAISLKSPEFQVLDKNKNVARVQRDQLCLIDCRICSGLTCPRS